MLKQFKKLMSSCKDYQTSPDFYTTQVKYFIIIIIIFLTVVPPNDKRFARSSNQWKLKHLQDMPTNLPAHCEGETAIFNLPYPELQNRWFGHIQALWVLKGPDY